MGCDSEKHHLLRQGNANLKPSPERSGVVPEEKKEGQVEKASSKQEYADLNVTNLKMVSETCNK